MTLSNLGSFTDLQSLQISVVALPIPHPAEEEWPHTVTHARHSIEAIYLVADAEIPTVSYFNLGH